MSPDSLLSSLDSLPLDSVDSVPDSVLVSELVSSLESFPPDSVDSVPVSVLVYLADFAVLGVQDLVIVDTEDALLICHKNQTQDIKKILAELKAEHKSELL